MKETEKSEDSVEQLFELPKKSIIPGEVIIGTLTGLDHQGKALVDFTDNPKDRAITAISTSPISLQHSGRQVALLFDNNDLEKPIIVGLIHNPLQDILDNFEIANIDRAESDNLYKAITDSEERPIENTVTTTVDDMLLDGERLVFEAKKEIVLKCGESSITLTKAGKILIKGKYLLNRSSGVNRIVGGSVQIN